MDLIAIDEQLDKIEDDLDTLEQSLADAINQGYSRMADDLTEEISICIIKHTRLTSERDYIMGIMDTAS